MPTELPDGVHDLALPTPFAVGTVNVQLIEDDPITLVDAGFGSTTALHALEQRLAERGLTIEDVGLVLLTHDHADHVGLADTIVRRSGAEVAAIDRLAALLGDDEQGVRARGRAMRRHVLRHGVDPVLVAALHRMNQLTTTMTTAPRVDRVLADGDRIRLRERTLTARWRPGHSRTDTIFHDAAAGVVFGGDHLLGTISSNALVTPTADGGRVRALLDQRRSLRATAALGATLVLAGHGAAVADPAELIATRLRQQDERAERLLALLADGPSTAHELGKRLLGSAAARAPYLALSEVLGHLDLLLEDGAVVEHAGEPTLFEIA